MYIVTINGVDSSCHTLEVDAVAQKQRYEADGRTNVVVESKATFSPPNTI